MTITKSSKSSDTREQLRRLMSQHTAATIVREAPSLPIQSPIAHVASAPVPVMPLSPVRSVPVMREEPRTQGAGERCTVRLSASELAKIDRLILETHQRAGERITTSDVLRVGLLRLTHEAPVSTTEINSLRATDSRRKQNRE